MLKIKNTKRLLLLIPILFFLCMLMNDCRKNINFQKLYQSMKITKVNSVIPKECYRPNEDKILKTEHMYYIEDKENKYYIYGSNLNYLDASDMENGMLLNKEDVNNLMNAKSLNKVADCLNTMYGFNINKIGQGDKISQPSLDEYYYTFEQNYNGELYEGFAIYLDMKGEHFVQIILYKDDLLTSEMKSSILLSTSAY